MFPAAGFQHTLMKKDFTPEGMMFGHNTLYFDNPKASPMAKEFVAWYADKHKDYPNWEADRAYFAIASYKAAVEAAAKAKGRRGPPTTTSSPPWKAASRSKASAAKAPGARTISPTRPSCRASPTHNNKYDFVTLDPAQASRPCTRPTCRSRPARISGNG